MGIMSKLATFRSPTVQAAPAEKTDDIEVPAPAKPEAVKAKPKKKAKASKKSKAEPIKAKPAAKAKPKAKAVVKKDIKPSMSATLRLILVKNPKMDVEKLVERLQEKGFNASSVTVGTLRSDCL